MKRQDALNIIVAEVAENGEVTRNATRLYIENRISYKVFQQAIAKGMRTHKNIQSGMTPWKAMTS